MSDFEPGSMLPTPPPPSAGASPFGAPGGAAPPPPVYAAPPGYTPMAAVGQKPPRPAVTVGAGLLAAGGALMIVGSFLNWFTIEGESFTGFSSDGDNMKDGPVFVFLGVLALAFGITQLMARKVLAVAILSVVFAVFGILAALADITDVSDAKDLADAFGIDMSFGPGLWIILVGAFVAVGGGVATIAKRRVWPLTM
ncbi:MAG: hypothetical protein R2694_02075 [Ilumatobacteraceae bacterium]